MSPASEIRSAVAATDFKLLWFSALLKSGVNCYPRCSNMNVLLLKAASGVFARLRLYVYHGVRVVFLLSRVYRLNGKNFFLSLLMFSKIAEDSVVNL
jgi:hypothetical protein